MLRRFEEFSGYVSNLNRCIQKIEADEMKKFGLKGSLAQYLQAMYHHPDGLTATELCRICGKDKAAVSRALLEMEQKELVVRPNESGYRIPVRLTEKGKKTAGDVCGRITAAVETAGRGVDPEQRRICYNALGQIAANLEAICKEGLK